VTSTCSRASCNCGLTNGRILLANCPEIPGILDVLWLAPTQECAFREFANSIRSFTISGRAADRPGLTEALNVVREKDALTVWKLDRLG
jgi:hypothetical protein